jgi:hypothetical protein
VFLAVKAAASSKVTSDVKIPASTLLLCVKAFWIPVKTLFVMKYPSAFELSAFKPIVIACLICVDMSLAIVVASKTRMNEDSSVSVPAGAGLDTGKMVSEHTSAFVVPAEALQYWLLLHNTATATDPETGMHVQSFPVTFFVRPSVEPGQSSIVGAGVVHLESSTVAGVKLQWLLVPHLGASASVPQIQESVIKVPFVVPQ